jgi:hypothetical protein
MPSASAQTKFVAAQVVSLRADSNFDERWLEKQITEQPVVLGLGNITVLHSQLIHKDGGRLDLLAEDKENQYLRGHIKSGQRWSLQNRPTESGLGLGCFTPPPPVEASLFSCANSVDHI